MIEVADSNAVSYYHFDGLGSVIALSDSAGDTVQTYEYSVYGQVAASDPNHPNPFLFTGRRFDRETGLYYYRARYYNPYIGRFLQTDSVGYDDGINWYAYCGNNPLSFADPFGTYRYEFAWNDDGKGFTLTLYDDNGKWLDDGTGMGSVDYYQILSGWEEKYGYFDEEWKMDQAAGKLWANSGSHTKPTDNGVNPGFTFWDIQFLIDTKVFTSDEIKKLGDAGVKLSMTPEPGVYSNQPYYNRNTNTVYVFGSFYLGFGQNFDGAPMWVWLAHELDHAYSHHCRSAVTPEQYEISSVKRENEARYLSFKYLAQGASIYPRFSYKDINQQWPGKTAAEAWAAWRAGDKKVIFE